MYTQTTESLPLFPFHISPLDTSISIETNQSLGVTTKIYLHEIARKLPSYNMPIQCHEHGIDKEGKTIEVNSLGRWIFGVPGFQENIRIVPQEKSIIIFYSSQAPNSVSIFLQQLKQVIEQQKN